MPIFSFIYECFVPSGSETGSEVRGSQLVRVDFEVASSTVQSVSVVSEAPISCVQSGVLHSHVNKSKVFKYSELREATDNFDCSRKLGRGSYGTVYLGKKLPCIFNFQSY